MMCKSKKVISLIKIERYQGFTLIETIISLGILLSVSCLLLPMLQINQQTHQKMEETSRQDWYVFMIQITNLVENYQLLEVESTKLSFYDEHGITTKHPIIEYYDKRHLIRKTSKKGGYEPLLMNVKKVQFQNEGNYVRIEVEFLNDEKYQGFLFQSL